MQSTNRLLVLTQMLGSALIGLLALTGCASGPKSFEIKASADALINRDAGGRPLSVVVHVYQLKDVGEFSKLTFDSLASGRPVSELLGKDLLEMHEVMLVPGSTQTLADKIHQDAKHVGVVAFFRQPDPHYWRLLADAEQVRRSGLNFRVQDCFLSLTTPKQSPIPGQPPAAPASCPGNDARPAATAIVPASTSSRPGTPHGKRSSILDTGRQAAGSLLTKRP